MEHEINEEILDTLVCMKVSIGSLLRSKLELIHTKKPDHVVDATFREKMVGRTALADSEWKWIINEVYDTQDASRLHKFIEAEQVQLAGLKYDTLVQFILSYQLAKQQTFVKPLVPQTSVRVHFCSSQKSVNHFPPR